MTSDERMAPVDRAWLLMDRPTNPMTIVGVIVLRGRLSLARLRELVGERMLAFDRFRCRPESDAFAACWRRCDDFHIEDHVTTAALPAPAAQAELEALVGELAGTPFNASRPWWSFHLVERFGRDSALIVRVHHCYADGIALLGVLLGLADGRPLRRAHPHSRADGERAAAHGAWLPAVPEWLTNAWQMGSQAIEQGTRLALHPARAAGVAADATAAAAELLRLALLRDDPPTLLKRPLSGSRRAAWAPPLPLAEIKSVARALGCTVNDVLMAVLAGALGELLHAGGERTRGITLHAAVPVNLRPEGVAPEALGNRFGLVFVELPIGVHDPLRRLYCVHDAMRSLKGSAQAMMTFGLLAAVGSLPQAVENAAIEAFTAKASLVASNVPGPADTIHIGGAAVRQLLFWVPQAGSIGTGVSLLSYDGRLQFGVMADRQLISDPARLAAAFVREFERLALLVALAREPGGHARRPRSVRARRAGGSPSRGSRSRRPGARAPRS